MSRLALLSIAALVLLSACVPDRGPRSSYYGDGYYGGGYTGDGYYRSGYSGGSRYGYKDGYRDRDRNDRQYRRYRQPAYDPRPAEGP